MGWDQWQGDAFSSNWPASWPMFRASGWWRSGSQNGREGVSPEIRRQLRVASVLSGSIRGKAGGMRVTIQLANSASGYMLWSRTF